MEGQPASIWDDPDDPYIDYIIANLRDPVDTTEEDAKKEAARLANNAYYAANKTKIQESRKKGRTEKKKKVCEDRKLPSYLADFIAFRQDGKIVLTFKDEEEFRKTLHWLKFKSPYGEEILKMEPKPEPK
jgi:hypothetical protein